MGDDGLRSVLVEDDCRGREVDSPGGDGPPVISCDEENFVSDIREDRLGVPETIRIRLLV